MTGAFTVDDAATALDDYFADWVRALDLTVEVTGPGIAELSMPVADALARTGGIVSGQAIMALADTAMVLAACAGFGAFVPVATTDFHCQFLRPGAGERLHARAEVVRAGRALVFTKVTIESLPSGKACATATATLMRP